jgi:endonuclease/exonuclease/phosphatase family metal-dependent hydrolase
MVKRFGRHNPCKSVPSYAFLAVFIRAILIRALLQIVRHHRLINTMTTSSAAATAHFSLTDGTGGYAELVDQFGQSAFEKVNNDGSRIRVEKEADPVIFGSVQTRSGILDKIAMVHAAQRPYGPTAVLDRQWGQHLDTSNKNSFTVMQFNTLAEGLSAGPDTVRAFPPPDDADTTATKRKNNRGMDAYGGFDAIPEPSIVLDFAAYRRWRLLEVMLGLGSTAASNDDNNDNSHSPMFDIIALEEVDRFYGFFAPALRLFGYEGVFTPKSDSPGSRTGWYSDGCGFFWKIDTFDLLRTKSGRYKTGTQVYLIATLRHKTTDKVLVVAVTHLKAQASAANDEVRSHQAKQLVESVVHETNEVIGLYGDPDPGVVIAGDFNTEPGPTISTVLASRIGQSTFTSAYPVNDPSRFFTTWKIRGPLEVKRMIDYIFFSGPLSCNNILLPPAEEDVGAKRLPSLRYPSDHVHIAAQFEFRTSPSTGSLRGDRPSST